MPWKQNDGDAFSERFRTRKQVDRYRDRYTTGRRSRIHRREESALAELLAGMSRVETVLDIPCGTGRLSPQLAAAADRIILADASPVMLEVARDDLRRLHAEATYLLTRAEHLDLPDDSVDIAFCHRLLHHIHDPALRSQTLRELARVARQYVIVSYYPSGFRTRFRWWLRRHVSQLPPEHGAISLRVFLGEVRGAGLRLVRCSTIRALPKAMFLLLERVSVAPTAGGRVCGA